MKQYISEVITQKEISKWKNGNTILITSQTGSGKSEFIKSNLYEYCKKNNKKILLMSNRTLLKNQNENDLDGKLEIITLYNYQKLESLFLANFDINSIYEQYDYIVLDELHYVFSDSTFNENTWISTLPIRDNFTTGILLFITATPHALLDYKDKEEYDYVYTIPQDYSYIKNIYFYNRGDIVNNIIETIPLDEKILYFGSNAEKALEIKNSFEDSAFICSQENSLRENSNLETIDNIVNFSKFEEHLLCSTKILDTGVNIIDSQLKHIIIRTYDMISFIQFLGRKRVQDKEDRIDLYVKNYHNGNLAYILRLINKELNRTDKSKKNIAKYYHNFTQKKFITDMLKDKDGFKKMVCKELDFDFSKIRFADQEFEKISLNKILAQYEGIELYKEDRNKFKKLFFENIFTPKIVDFRYRGLIAINAILKETNLAYKIISIKETKVPNRNKTYWKIEGTK